MAHEQYQQYYKASTEVFNRLDQEYTPTFTQRMACIKAFLEDTGAITFTRRSLWGGVESIAELVYPATHPLAQDSGVKITRRTEHDGQPVVCLTGKKSSKTGKQLNAKIAQFNDKLKPLPTFGTWLLTKYDLLRTGLGGLGPKGHGQVMLSSQAGKAGPDDAPVLVVSIPKGTKDEPVTPVTVPEWLEPITYGQFYDLTNADAT